MYKLFLFFTLFFSVSVASADEPTQIPAEEDFFIGQIVNVNTGSWGTGEIVGYDGTRSLYRIKTDGFMVKDPFSYVDRMGSQLRPRSNRRSLQVLPDEPLRKNIKAEVEEIKPEFKFKQGAVVVSDYRHFFWADNETTTRIIDRAVLWGENVYRVERNRRRSPGDNGPGIWYETISEKDLQLPPKKQPEYVEGLQP
jgi:hypothetical protein